MQERVKKIFASHEAETVVKDKSVNPIFQEDVSAAWTVG
jgi:hypothetical protein